MELIESVFLRNNLIVAFAVVGITIWVSYLAADKLTHGRIHGSAMAIALGLVAAYFGGVATGGTRGVADIALLGGIGLMGGGMMRDFAIVATAFGVQLGELKKAGLAGVISIFAGVVVSFVVGAAVAILFGYTDPAAITTIGAGAVTYIVGPVTQQPPVEAVPHCLRIAEEEVAGRVGRAWWELATPTAVTVRSAHLEPHAAV